jgi:hypothetical protein
VQQDRGAETGELAPGCGLARGALAQEVKRGRGPAHLVHGWDDRAELLVGGKLARREVAYAFRDRRDLRALAAPEQRSGAPNVQ